VNKLYDTRSDLVLSVDDQLTYLISLDFSLKFNAKSIKFLSENVKYLMLNWQQWRNKVDAMVYWLNVTLNSQKNVFVYIRQLELVVFHYADTD
jgi:hypothetical protein